MVGWVAASSYAASPPPPALVCVAAGGPVALAGYPVRIPYRTADAIDHGDLAADCSDLWVSDDQLAPVPFWLEDCGAAEAHLWAAVDVDPAGPAVTLLVHTTGIPGASTSDGSAVFPLLFDDFDDPAAFAANWREIGTGDGDLSGGRYESHAVKALVSTSPALSADDSELVVAIDAAGGWDDDVEIGGGDIDADGATDYLWHGSRRWYGFSHVTYLDAYYDTIGGTTPVSVGGCVSDWYAGEWLPETGQGAAPRRVTVSYDRAGGSRLDTDAGVSIARSAGASGAACAAASPLPALIVLDHASGGANPTQHLDYVFVRPRLLPEPVATIVDDGEAGDDDGDGVPSWQEGCGDADADGVLDYEDADTPGSSTPGTTTTTPPTTTTSDPVATNGNGSPSTTPPSTGTSEGTAAAGTDRTGASGAGQVTSEIGCGCAHGGVGGAGWALLALGSFGAARRRPADPRRG